VATADTPAQRIKVTEAEVVFVAVDTGGRPVPIKP
jgi:acyl-CoA hydrolase